MLKIWLDYQVTATLDLVLLRLVVVDCYCRLADDVLVVVFAVVMDDDQAADELKKMKSREAGDDEVLAGGAHVVDPRKEQIRGSLWMPVAEDDNEERRPELRRHYVGGIG